MRQAVVMEGSLENRSAAAVLRSLRRSAHRLEVQITGPPRGSGRIVVEGGRVLEAEASDGQAGKGAFLRLVNTPGQGFRVYRRAGGEQRGRPIGTLDALMQEADILGGRARTRLLEGAVDGGGLSELFEVLALSRHLLEVVFSEPDGEVGSVCVQEGVVVRARAPDVPEGHEAFAAILDLVHQSPSIRFTVSRLRGCPIGARTLGDLERLAGPLPRFEPWPLRQDGPPTGPTLETPLPLPSVTARGTGGRGHETWLLAAVLVGQAALVAWLAGALLSGWMA